MLLLLIELINLNNNYYLPHECDHSKTVLNYGHIKGFSTLKCDQYFSLIVTVNYYTHISVRTLHYITVEFKGRLAKDAFVKRIWKYLIHWIIWVTPKSLIQPLWRLGFLCTIFWCHHLSVHYYLFIDGFDFWKRFFMKWNELRNNKWANKTKQFMNM